MPSNTPGKRLEGSDNDNEQKDCELATKPVVVFEGNEHVSESDENSGNEAAGLYSREVTKEIRRRRNTIVNSFRLAELVPTTNTPHSQYRRKSIVILTTETVIDTKAEEQ